MGFSTIEQLIARGTPSPLEKMRQGITGGLGILGSLQNLRQQQLLNQMRQAQAQIAPQLAQAQVENLPLQRQLLQAKIATEQSLPQLKQLEMLATLAKIKQVGQVKPSEFLTAYNEYNDAYKENPGSAKTRALAQHLQKLMQVSSGASVSVTPGGETNVQIGGSQPLANQAPAPIAPGEVLHPSHVEQVNENRITQASQLFPPTNTAAQLADQKQLGEDLKSITSASTNASENSIPLFRKLNSAINNLVIPSGPVIGKLEWASEPGQRLQQLLAVEARNMMSQVKGLRTQKEFDKLLQGIGTVSMKSSVLRKIANDALDEAYQNRLKQDFYKNYMSQGGNSASEAANLWAKILTNASIDKVPDKFLNFNVSGTNRNFSDYVKTIKNLIEKNPNAKGLQNLPLISLIREDTEGE